MYRLNKMVSMIWAITYGITIEDKRLFCALMAVLFALFYIGEKK